MFNIDEGRTFKKRVVFNHPTESGVDKQVTLETEFKSLQRSELIAMQQDCDDSEAYERVVTGVHGVVQGGDDMPPAEAKTAMGEVNAFVFQALMTYYQAMQGNSGPKTSRKRLGTG